MRKKYVIPTRVPVPFFVAFVGRSGSTYLYHLLNQHSDVACYKEVFDPGLYRYPKRVATVKAVRRLVKLALGRGVVRWLRLTQVYGPVRPRARGFQYKIEKGKDYDAFPEVADWLATVSNMKCIHLYRRNVLKGAVSMQNYKNVKKKYRAANVRPEEGLPQGEAGFMEPFSVDVERALREARERKASDKRFFREQAWRFDTMLLAYEDLIADPATAMREISEFLGVEVCDTSGLVAPTRKLTSDKLSDAVKNYEKLAERAVEAGLGRYLD